MNTNMIRAIYCHFNTTMTRANYSLSVPCLMLYKCFFKPARLSSLILRTIKQDIYTRQVNVFTLKIGGSHIMELFPYIFI